MGHRGLLVTHNLSDGKCHYCWPHPRGSVRRASGFVHYGLTGSNPPWTKAGFTDGWMGIIGEIGTRRRRAFSKTSRSSEIFSIFVREAAEHKGKITGTACGQMHEYSLADIRKLAA